MLGRLGRWLRVLGYDTAYDRTLADPVLVRLAEADKRILLTRDRHLLRDLRPARALELHRDSPLEQLTTVVTTLRLGPPPGLFTRCLLCNVLLSEPLPPAEVEVVVPAM